MAKYSNGKIDSLDIPDSSVIVLESRYLTKDDDGNIVETGEELLKRVAKDIAIAELLNLSEFKEQARGLPRDGLYELAGKSEEVKKWEKEFFEMMVGGYFFCNFPSLI